MKNEFTRLVTFEWLEKNGLTGSCKSCGIKGIFCDEDLEIFFKSKFHPAGHIVDDRPLRKHIDDRSELCLSCQQQGEL